jgi:hypothetical protein
MPYAHLLGGSTIMKRLSIVAVATIVLLFAATYFYGTEMAQQPNRIPDSKAKIDVNDIQSALELTFWKFAVNCPAKKFLRATLEIREGGQPKAKLVSLKHGPGLQEVEVLVSLRPLEGTLTESEKIEVSLHVGKLGRNYVGRKKAITNPLRGQIIDESRPAERDGRSVILMKGRQPKPGPQPENAIVLVVDEEAPK